MATLRVKSTPKKYALVGTSCVGKTTLLLDLKDTLKKEFPTKKIAVVPEAARIYFERRKSKKPFSYFHQSRIQKLAKLQEEIAHHKKPDFILCDRSVIDAVVYLKALGDGFSAEKLLKRVENWLSTYTYFFILDPNDIVYQTDETRKEMWITRQRFHKAFVKFFKETKVSYKILSGTRKDRVKRILQVLKND